MLYILPVGLSAEVSFSRVLYQTGFNLTSKGSVSAAVLSRDVAAPCGHSDSGGAIIDESGRPRAVSS